MRCNFLIGRVAGPLLGGLVSPMKLAFQKAAAAQLARQPEPRRKQQGKSSDEAKPRGPSPLLLAGAAALAALSVAGIVVARRRRVPEETPADSSGACDHEDSEEEAVAPAVPGGSVLELPLLEHAGQGDEAPESAELAALRAEHERLIREATAALLPLRHAQGAQEEEDVTSAELDLSWALDAVQTAEQAFAQVVSRQAEVRTERAAINAVGMQAEADWVAAVDNARALLDEQLEHLAQLHALRLDALQFCKARASGAQAAFDRLRLAAPAAASPTQTAPGTGHLEMPAAPSVQPHDIDAAVASCESPAHPDDIAATVDAALDDILDAVCEPDEGRSASHIPAIDLWSDGDALSPRHQQPGPEEAMHIPDNPASPDVLAEASAVSRALASATSAPVLLQPPLPRFKLKSSLPVLTTVFTPSSGRRASGDKVQPVEARLLVVTPPQPPLLADARAAAPAPMEAAARRPSATLPQKRAAPAASSEAGPSRVATRLGVAAVPKRGPGSPRKGRRVALRTEKPRPADAQVVVPAPVQQPTASQPADSTAGAFAAADAAVPQQPVAVEQVAVAAVADAVASVTAAPVTPLEQPHAAPLPAPAPIRIARQLSATDVATARSTGATPREVATTSAAQELRSASRALLAPAQAGTPMSTSTPGAAAAAQQLLAAAQQLNLGSSAAFSTASPSAASAADELRAMSRRLLSPSRGEPQSPQVASAAGDLLRAAMASRGEQAVQEQAVQEAAQHPPVAEASEAQSVAGSQKAASSAHLPATQQKRAHEDAKRRAEREVARKQVEQQRAEERAKARAAAEESCQALEAAKRRRVEEAAAKAHAVAEGQRLAADAAKALAERQRAEATAAKQRAIAEERKRAEEAALRKAEDDRLAAEAAVARAEAEHQRVAIEASKKLRADEAAAKTRREAEEQRRADEEARKQAERAKAEAAAAKARALSLEQRRAKEAQAERERAEAAAAKARAIAEEERKAQLAAAKLAELDAKARALAEERELVTGRKRPVASRQQALKKEVVKVVREELASEVPAVAVVIATERATQPIARASEARPAAAAVAAAPLVVKPPVVRPAVVPAKRKPRMDDDEEPATDWYLQ